MHTYVHACIHADEAKGQVPVFYSERVSFVSGGKTTFPFFFAKEDLDQAFSQAQVLGYG